MTYDSIKSHKKATLHSVSRGCIFRETTKRDGGGGRGGVKIDLFSPFGLKIKI